MNWIVENWAVILPIVLLLVGILMRLVPSDSPAKKWTDIIGTILLALLKDKSKVKDGDGKSLSHDEVKILRKVRNDSSLLSRFGLLKRD